MTVITVCQECVALGVTGTLVSMTVQAVTAVIETNVGAERVTQATLPCGHSVTSATLKAIPSTAD